jgi:hypothetical protein
MSGRKLTKPQLLKTNFINDIKSSQNKLLLLEFFDFKNITSACKGLGLKTETSI